MEDEGDEDDEAIYDGNTTGEESSGKKLTAAARAERYASRNKGVEPVIQLN